MTAHAEQDLLLDLAYGELSEREARRVRAHLAGCAECSAELERIDGTRKLFSALPEVPAPEAGERILLAAAREAADRARPAGRLPRWLVPAAALAATVAIVSAVTLRLGLPGRGVDDEVLMRAPAAVAPASPGGVSKSATASAEGEREALAAAPAEKTLEKKRSANRELRATSAPPPSRYAKAPEAPAAAPPPPSAAPRPARRADLAEAAGPVPAPEARLDTNAGEADAKEESGAVGGGLASARAQAPAAAPEDEPRAGEAAPVARSRKAAAPASAAVRAEERAAAAPGAAGDGAGGLGAALQPPLVQAFPGCAGETRREIGRDAGGRVVRFVREGVAGGRRVRVELRFAGDGSLVSTRARDLDTGQPLPPDALPGLPRSAAQVDAGTPPRCGP